MKKKKKKRGAIVLLSFRLCVELWELFDTLDLQKDLCQWKKMLQIFKSINILWSQKN